MHPSMLGVHVRGKHPDIMGALNAIIRARAIRSVMARYYTHAR